MAAVDCGVLSYVWIRQSHATEGVVYFWDSSLARLSALQQNNFFCSGEHAYTYEAGTNALEYGVWSSLTIPYEPFLMGLGGLLCAALVAMAFMKSL